MHALLRPGAANALDAIADGRATVVVGTHALFSERVRYANLGLVVVDEQHRFGVEQRGALEAKTTRGAAHVLLMTATPIPRTVGQVVYADLDVSDQRSVPPGASRSGRPSAARTISGGCGPSCARRPARAGGRSSSSPTSTRRRTARRRTTAGEAEAEAERLRGLLAPPG